MPAGATYEPIATTTVSGSSAANITFSSIPSTYTDLVLILFGRCADTGTSTTAVRYEFNGDTATNYSDTYLYGTGSSALSARDTSQTYIKEVGEVANGGTASGIFSLIKSHIFSYSGSTNKTVLTENSADINGSGFVLRSVGLWRSTSAINQIKITMNAGNIAVGSTATLYGIKAA